MIYRVFLLGFIFCFNLAAMEVPKSEGAVPSLVDLSLNALSRDLVPKPSTYVKEFLLKIKPEFGIKIIETLLIKHADIAAQKKEEFIEFVDKNPHFKKFLGGCERALFLELHSLNDLQKKDDMLPVAIEQGHRFSVSALLKHRASVNATKARDESCLHLAVKLGNQELVAGLLKAGAEINSQTLTGSTPLHHAVNGYFMMSPATREAIVEKLLKAGADQTLTNRSRKTPLDTVGVQGHFLGNIEKIKALFAQFSKTPSH